MGPGEKRISNADMACRSFLQLFDLLDIKVILLNEIIIYFLF